MSVIAIFNEYVRPTLIPPVSFLLMFFIGWAIKKRYPKTGRVLRGSALLILFLLSTNQGSLALVYPLEHLQKPLTNVQGTNAQAIVVLTCGRTHNALEYNGKDVPDYVALTRIRYAAKLYRETHLPILVTGGLGVDYDNKESLAVEMARVFEGDFLIPVKWREQLSADTSENAKFSAAILKSAGVKKILLVTDAMHMHRSRLAFEKAGLQVIPAPTAFYSNRNPYKLNLGAMDEHFRQSTYAMHEWIGLIWYALSNKI